MRQALDVNLSEVHSLAVRWKLNFTLSFNSHSRRWHATVSPPRQRISWEARSDRPYAAMAEAVFLARTDLGLLREKE